MTKTDNKITREEYLKALDIVESYHEQIFHEANIIRQSPIVQTKLSDFIQHCNDMPGLLCSALNEYLRVWGDLPLKLVMKSDFLKLRNAGKKSWNKFEELRENYIANKL